jgi:hypothetical protein
MTSESPPPPRADAFLQNDTFRLEWEEAIRLGRRQPEAGGGGLEGGNGGDNIGAEVSEPLRLLRLRAATSADVDTEDDKGADCPQAVNGMGRCGSKFCTSDACVVASILHSDDSADGGLSADADVLDSSEDESASAASASPAVAAAASDSSDFRKFCLGVQSAAMEGHEQRSFAYVYADTVMPHALKKRKWMYGGADYYDSCKDVPGGPRSLDEICNVGKVFLDDLFGPRIPGGLRRHHRTLALLERGLVTHHDYAGRQGFEVALKLVSVDLAFNGLSVPWLCYWRTSETCRRSRLSLENGTLQPEHSFAALEDIHMRPEDIEYCNVRRPSDIADRWAWIEYIENHQKYMDTNAADIFCSGQRSSKCQRHPGKQCPVRWEDSRPLPERALTLGCGGPHCLPWTRGGSRLGVAHPAQEQYNIFIAEHSSGKFDLSLVEEAEDMPPEHYTVRMRPRYKCVYATFGPEDLGLPYCRKRFMGAGLNLDSLIWVGPNTEDITAHFLMYFKKMAMLDASVYVGLDKAGTEECHRQYAKRRKVEGAVGAGGVGSLAEILPQYAQDNLEECKRLRSIGAKVGVMNGVAADISQNPCKRHRAGPFLPTLQKSSIPVCLADKCGPIEHMYSCSELSFAHGWPVTDAAPLRYRTALNYDLAREKLAHQTRLLGDGMSLHAVQAWCLYIFAHTIRRDTVERMVPPLTIARPQQGSPMHESEYNYIMQCRVAARADARARGKMEGSISSASSAVGPQSAQQQLFQQRRAHASASARANDDEPQQQEAEPEAEDSVGCGGDDEAKESFEFCADGERGDGDY